MEVPPPPQEPEPRVEPLVLPERPLIKDLIHCEEMIAMSHDQMRKTVHDIELHKRALAFCNESIAYSLSPEITDDLPRGYADRAEILGHLEKYDEALVDLERALAYPFNDIKRAKLLTLKAQYIMHVDKSKCADVIREARLLVNELMDEPRRELTFLLNKAEQALASMSTEGELPRIVQRPEQLDLYTGNFEIKRNEEFGRHLTLARDVETAEILMVQNIYAKVPGKEAIYLLCSFCLNPAWNGIPCDSCPAVLYCSEECMEKAWRNYHQVECTLLTTYRVNELHSDMERLIIRIFSTVLQDETSGWKISKILAMHEEELRKNFAPENFLTGNFRSLCHLFTNEGNFPIDEETTMREMAARISNVFTPILFQEPIVPFSEWEALVLKIIKIAQVNHMPYTGYTCFCESPKKMLFLHTCENLTLGLMLAGNAFNLINHDCLFNAGWTMKDGKVIVYSTRPLKKGTQIVITYSPTLLESKEERQLTIQKHLYFTCNCIPCKFDWVPIPDLLAKYNQLDTFLAWRTNEMMKTEETMTVYEKYRKILPTLKNYITNTFRDQPENVAIILTFHYQYFLTQVMHKIYGLHLYIPAYCCKGLYFFNLQ